LTGSGFWALRIAGITLQLSQQSHLRTQEPANNQKEMQGMGLSQISPTLLGETESKSDIGRPLVTTSDAIPRQGRIKYRADIDGLRAVAVLSVLGFHMELAAFHGGFVGVDVFFVISGYLISAIVFSEIADGSYSIKSFYERRIRRIFPALFAMLLVFSACTLIYIFPTEMVNYAKSLLAATTSVSNFYFWQHSGYFDSPTSHPLLHTWSLAVEEQFYIFFPLYLWTVRRFFPKQLRLSVAVLFFASLLASVIIVHVNLTTAFYMPYTRAWELLLGTFLALKVFPKLPNSLLRNAASTAGIAMIVYSVLTYKQTMVFPGFSALLPCVGSALIIHAGETGSSAVGKVLAWRPVVFIGLISYSLYLWHWPVILLHKTGLLLSMSSMPSRLVSGIAPRHYDDAVEIILSIVLAILSWRFVEKPFRAGRLRLSGKPLFLMAGAAVAICVSFSIFAILSGGIRGRMAPEAERIASYHTSFRNSFRMGSCFLTPEFTMKDFDHSRCLQMDGTKKNFLLLGDSHAAALWPGAVRALAPANILQASVSACRPILRESGTGTCHQMMDYIFQDFLIHNRVDGLLLQARWETRDIAELTETIEWAKSHQIPVILVGPNPEYDAPLPRLLGYSIAWHDPSYASRHRISEPVQMEDILEKLAVSTWHVPYVSLYKALCHQDICTEYADTAHTLPILTDTDHFTEPGSVYSMQKAFANVEAH
jgi:peptidoglycan/LPS O-acetylase OafA/YrhL